MPGIWHSEKQLAKVKAVPVPRKASKKGEAERERDPWTPYLQG